MQGLRLAIIASDHGDNHSHSSCLVVIFCDLNGDVQCYTKLERLVLVRARKCSPGLYLITNLLPLIVGERCILGRGYLYWVVKVLHSCNTEPLESSERPYFVRRLT